MLTTTIGRLQIKDIKKYLDTVIENFETLKLIAYWKDSGVVIISLDDL